jgi:Trk K+ transport system NAD-binding subunit
MSNTTLTLTNSAKLDVLRYTAPESVAVVTCPLSPRSKFLNKLVSTISLPEGLELVGLQRNGEMLTASVMEFLRRGDQLVLSLRNVQMPDMMSRLIL